MEQSVDSGNKQHCLYNFRLLLLHEYIHENQEILGNQKKGSDKVAYDAAAHLGDEERGDDDDGAQHDEVVLEREKECLSCKQTNRGVRGERKRVSFREREAEREGYGRHGGGLVRQ